MTGNQPLREISERLYFQVARDRAEDDARTSTSPTEFAAFRREMADPPPPPPGPPARPWRRRGIELLIVSDPSNMHWLTGYDGWSFYVHQGVLVPPEESDLVRPRPGRAGAQRTAWLGDADIVGYPDHYVQSTERHPMDYLAGIVLASAAGAGSASASRWTTTGSPPPPSRCSSATAERPLRDATGLVNWQRAVKSPTEIGYMRNAARIVEAMHARIAEKVRAGMRKCDLVAEIYDAGTRGADGFGGDYPAIVPLLPSGADASAPHLTWDDQPMQPGEGTFFEIAGCYHRYHCPLSRTVFLGLPTQASSTPRRRRSKAWRPASPPRPATPARTSPSAFFAVLDRTASSRTTAPATRSASPTRRIGASAP